MSSILKALKRIEQQKVVRKGADHDIAWIVRDADFRPEKKRQWTMAASFVTVALVAVLSTYWFMGGFRDAPRDSQPRLGTEVGSSPGTRPSGLDTPPGSTPDSATVPSAVANRPAEKDLRRPAGEEPLKGGLPGSEKPPIVSPGIPQPHVALPSRPDPAPVLQAPKPSLPALTVSGIAGEKDSPNHLAIVNGKSVVEGSLVDGVKVEKILPDRVRFTFENRSFDVPLN